MSMMTAPRFHLVLVEPEIPPNTGNVARLAAATGCRLHLVAPLGFSLEDRYLRRAGLDYWPHVDLRVHDDWDALVQAERPGEARMWLFSARAERSFRSPTYRRGDWLVFGGESDGLPAALRARYVDRLLAIPMDQTRVRSLNLANSVAVAVYEGLRCLE